MIVLDDISLRIAGRLLLDHASVAIPEGAHVGVVGRNGAGKTTLFKAIMGEMELESGVVRLPNRTRIGRVAQEAPAGPDSLLERVLAADTERAALLEERESAADPMRIAEVEMRLVDIEAHSAPARAARILAGLGFDEAAQARACSEFSGGWRMRVALAALLFTSPDLLMLDEPTNYLDLEGTLWLQDYLASYPGTIILISHDRDLLDESVDHILHFFNGKLTLYRGTFTSFDRQRREKLMLDQKHRKKQEAQRAHMESFIARFRAKATKAKQAQSRMKALARMEPVAPEVGEQEASISIRHPEKLLSPPIVTMERVEVGYVEGQPILKNLNLRIDEDDRIALLGPNGNGKSTFAKLLADRLKPQRGDMVRADKLEVAYLAQHQLDELRPGESPAEHVRRLMPDAPEARVRARAAEMGFSGGAGDTKVSALSGGEKARLLLGLAAFNGPHLLILDEPTNHLDIQSREALITAINDYPGAVILVSHDRHLLEACADRLWMVGNGTVKPYDGDLDQYRREVLSRTGRMTGEGRKDKETQETSSADAEGLALRKRVRDAEALMAKLEKDIAAIDKRLADPKLAKFPADEARLTRQRAEAVEALASAEENWIEASSALETVD
ncbi:MAG: glycosyl transferase family 1 [Rhizobiales bacterium 17-65-6]|nr:MAG: glycosyl transferase family 1 [Azorhizobium sp. 32-67-21]OYZ90731.1 MAG: glycosyl transferase family 1 [Rhizobiales bacterium 17-65-6]